VDLLARFSADPARAAVLLDVDGALAPIVPRPEDARVPRATRAELRRLADRYALVACISGRAGDDARRIVGVPELVYVGNHGLELDPEAADWADRLQELLRGVDWPQTENKTLSAALHYRNVDDEADALERLTELAAQAERAGFVTRFGRKVLEVVPPLAADKGTAVRQLLARRDLHSALYAGDDTTDLDAFAALEELELGIRIAVSSPEGPAELRARADIVVDSPAELLGLLRTL
jgi:trehalose 6-phosphate phosphatase